MDDKTLKRFLAKADLDDGGRCWIWHACLCSEGYGNFGIGSRTDGSRRTVRAHRFSYEHFVGPIPDELEIDHLCRNRACINPWHLEPVTSKVNTLRGDTQARRNAQKTHCPAGHPYNEENTRYSKDGSRSCRLCAIDRHHKFEWKGGVRPEERTHCPQGHPYDEANTAMYRGCRLCRICRRIRQAERRRNRTT